MEDAMKLRVEITYYPESDADLPIEGRKTTTTTFRVEGNETKECLHKAIELAKPMALGANAWVTGYTYVSDEGNDLMSVSQLGGGAINVD